MAKKEPPQEYIEVLEVLNVLYDEVDGMLTCRVNFSQNRSLYKISSEVLRLMLKMC